MRKIGILSPSGTGNLGDEATVAVLIEEIRRRYPDAEIYGLTSNPSDTRQRHKIPAYPARNTTSNASMGKANDRRDTVPHERVAFAGTTLKRIRAWLKKVLFLYAALKAIHNWWSLLVNSIGEFGFVATCLKRIKSTDLLIVAGSGQLCDNFYGAWGFPYTLLKWSVIAKASGAKLAFMSCGAGPIDSPLSKMFLKAALRLADYRSFRDQGSKKLIAKIGIHGNDPVFPDLVFGLKPGSNGHHVAKSKIIAINPFPHYDYRYWPVSAPDVYSSYIKRLSYFAAWLIENKYTVLFFPTQLRADPLVIEDVKTILRKDKKLDLDKHLLVKATTTFDDLIAQISMADIVVASRFHGVLISFLMKKPVLALSHHPKVDDLMRDMGQSDYLLGIDTFDFQSLKARLISLESKTNVVKQQIESKVTFCRGKLESQYSEVFGSIEPLAGRTPSAILVRHN